uniref:Uncharacterized protein n=1 Tax=Mycena chlorophos TaxID=658473 RepID=A0ABQ0LZM6_MYCCL|nr:predicted protein [Mycena chlorophos]
MALLSTVPTQIYRLSIDQLDGCCTGLHMQNPVLGDEDFGPGSTEPNQLFGRSHEVAAPESRREDLRVPGQLLIILR